jgi:hypothetical protein
MEQRTIRSSSGGYAKMPDRKQTPDIMSELMASKVEKTRKTVKLYNNKVVKMQASHRE